MGPLYLEPAGPLATLSPDSQQVILTAEYLHYVLSRPVNIGALCELLDMTPELVTAVLSHPEVVDALEQRGINTGTAAIPERQFTFLLCLFNPLDTRNHKQIMADLGISLSEFYGWQHTESFKRLQNRLAADFFQSAGLFIDRELIRRAMSGSAPHMRLYYEQKQDQAMNPRVVMQRLVDIVQRYIKDPEIQRSIGDEIMGTTKVIQGEVH